MRQEAQIVDGKDLQAALDTPPGRKLVLIVGCPRSGTTWLQLLLSQHPKIASCNETAVFIYAGRLHGFWREQSTRPASDRPHGLSELLSEEEFYGLCRDFAAAVLAKIGQLRPGAQVVVEKTPEHLLQWELILKLFPGAYFLHVIRDPRGVAASMLAASRSAWGATWAPKSLITATRRWRLAIETGRRLAAVTERYREVRYESLLADGPRELGQVLTWLGLPHTPDFPASAVDACQIDKLRSASSKVAAPWSLRQEPSEFFRRGEAESWRQELRKTDVKTLEYLVRDLMIELGYPLAGPDRLRKPVAVRLRHVADAIHAAVEWRSKRWLDWLGA
jgi:hypothetical protein